MNLSPQGVPQKKSSISQFISSILGFCSHDNHVVTVLFFSADQQTNYQEDKQDDSGAQHQREPRQSLRDKVYPIPTHIGDVETTK